MSCTKIKRFSALQIVLHWGQAIGYLVLLGSGAVMLGQRILRVEIWKHERISLVHRTAGLLLLGFLLGIFVVSRLSGRWRDIKQDIISCLFWRRGDFIWLLKVPFNILCPGIRLPAAGRFNAGQKLHGAFIFLAVPFFALSGLAMYCVPGALAAWVIHIALFFIALGFLGLHLFLALINPPTRKSLPGIFSGYVGQDYAHNHHPLWTGINEAPRHGPVVSRKALLAVLLLAASLAVMGIWTYGPERFGRQLASRRWSEAIEMVDPGDLAASHADDPQMDGCLSCHRWFGQTDDSACLSCHQKIEQRLASGLGYHGRLSEDCGSCHLDHKGYSANIRHLDSKGFDHRQARFALNGKHQAVECLKCHLVKKQGTAAQRELYIGVKFESCLACHANPHNSDKADDCERCHNEQGWKEKDLLFVHNRDCDFPIDAIHSGLSCTSCHKGQGFPLYQSLAKTCQGCHTEAVAALAGKLPGQTGPADPHDGRVDCTKCHLPQIADPRAEQYAQTCRDCHNEHYRDLFFDWSNSLQARQAKAERILEAPGDATPAEIEQLTKTINQAKMAGLHNVQLARQLWDQVLSHDDLKSKEPPAPVRGLRRKMFRDNRVTSP